MAERLPLFASRFARDQQREEQQGFDQVFIELKDDDLPNYFFGRLVWEGMAKLCDIEDWRYSIEDLNRLHDMLDLKEKIDQKMNESMNG